MCDDLRNSCPRLDHGRVIQFAFKVRGNHGDILRPCYYLAERCVRHFIIPFREHYRSFELFYHFDKAVKARVEVDANTMKKGEDLHIRFFEREFDPSIAPGGFAIRVNSEFFYNDLLMVDAGKVLVQDYEGVTYFFPDRPCDYLLVDRIEHWGMQGYT